MNSVLSSVLSRGSQVEGFSRTGRSIVSLSVCTSSFMMGSTQVDQPYTCTANTQLTQEVCFGSIVRGIRNMGHPSMAMICGVLQDL